MMAGYDTVRAFPGGEGQPGITIREYIASQALQGILAACYGDPGIKYEFAAQEAVTYTDELIKVLYGKQQP
jgi:hypothetical protein